MKKILYVANIRLPTEKAHGIQIMKMCEAFAKLGHEVTLVVPRRVSHIKDEVFFYYGMKKSFGVIYLPCIDLIRLSGFVPKFFAFLQNWTFARTARKFIEKNKADLIYTRDELTVKVIKSTINIMLEIHNISRILRQSAKNLNGKLKKIIVITSALKRELVGLGFQGDKIHILPDGVDLKDFADVNLPAKESARKELNLPLDKKIIMYTGNFFAWKGVYTLADSSLKFGKDYLFVFVGGSPDEEQKFKKYLDEKGLIGKIRLEGHVPYLKIPIYLAAADVSVLPNSAKSDISKYYTSPLKLFEYLASGTAIAASDLPSIREIVSEEQVEFAAPDDPESLALALSRAFSRDFSQNRKFAERYSWAKRAEKIIDLVEN
jgi:glycosyltransferase involved in cell wall biosynthesis